MAVTIKDVAKQAGVSVTTVSRVLNNKPDVSPKTRDKILEIIDELGYNPNGVARGLVMQRTFTLGLIIPDISNPFFPEVARAIEDKAQKLGYSVIFYNTDNHPENEKKAIDLLCSKQVDGLIVSLSLGNGELLQKLQKKNFPVVQIDRSVPGSDYPAVMIDNKKSSFEIVEYLINAGHQRIAHITGDLHTATARDRLAGYQQALEKADLKVNDKLIINGDYSKDSGWQAMNYLLQLPKKPTAVFAANDLMAIGAYSAAFSADYQIPEDISVVGHDDIDVASVIRPELTTIKQPKYVLGEMAVDLLVQMIEEKSKILKSDKILKADLIIRKSVKRF